MSSVAAPPLDHLVSRLLARSYLGAVERSAILGLQVKSRSIANGHTLVCRGDVVDGICLVAEGLVGSFREARAGAQQIVALHIPGDMADLASIAENEAGYDLKALADTVVVRLGHSELRELVATFPLIAAAFWRDSLADARVLAEWAFNIGSKTARARIAHLLCEMAYRYEQVGWQVELSFELPMTQEQLSRATAMTPVHLNRSMMGLRQDGIVTMRGRIVEIHDWQAMIEIAEFDSRYLHFNGPTAHQ